MLTLQINSTGAWRKVVQFDADQRTEVLDGVKGLAQALGPGVTWCVLREDGQREWLHGIHEGAFPGWEDVTPTSPPPLQDVLVSAFDKAEGVGIVYQAWRSGIDPDRWILSGSEEPLLLPVYAWGPVMDPQDVPAAMLQQAAA